MNSHAFAVTGRKPIVVWHTNVGANNLDKSELNLIGRNPHIDESGNLWYVDKVFRKEEGREQLLEISLSEYDLDPNKDQYLVSVSCLSYWAIIQIRFEPVQLEATPA